MKKRESSEETKIMKSMNFLRGLFARSCGRLRVKWKSITLCFGVSVKKAMLSLLFGS